MHFEKVILFGSFDDKDPKLTALFYSFLFIYISYFFFGCTLITGWSWVGWLYIPGVTVILYSPRKRTRDDSDINVQNKGSVTIECMSRSILDNLKIQHFFFKKKRISQRTSGILKTVISCYHNGSVVIFGKK